VKRLLRVVAWLLLALVVFGILLLFTPLGLRLAAWQARARLDGFEVQSVEGSVFRDMHLRGLRWHRDGLVVEVDEATLSLDRLRAFGGLIGLTRLDAQGVRITVGESHTPPSTSPLALPDLAFSGVDVRDLRVDLGGDQEIVFTTITGAIAMADTTLQLDGLRARGPQGDLDATVAFDLSAVLPRPEWHAIDPARLIDGTGKLALTWRDGETPWRIAGELRNGGPADFALASPFVARATITHATDRAQWHAEITLPPATATTAWPDALAAIRPEGRAIVDGRKLESIALDFAGRLADHSIALKGKVDAHAVSGLTVDLAVSQPECIAPCFEGTITLAGELPTNDDAPLALEVALQDVILQLDATERVAAQGTVTLSQTLAQPRLQPNLTLQREGMPNLAVDGSVRVTDTHVVAEALRIASGTGHVAIAGALPRAPEATGSLVLDITALDPSLLLREWPGRLDGRVRFDGAMPTLGQFTGDAAIDSLRGSLRERDVSATGNAHLDANVPTTFAFDARSGGARLIAARAAVDAPIIATLRAPSVADLLPDARGALDAEIAFLADQWLTIEANAGALSVGDDIAVDTLRAELRFAPLDDPLPRGTIVATGLAYAGFAFETVNIDAQGEGDQHDITAKLARGDESYDVRVTGAWREGGWQGKLEHARWLAGDGAPAATLREPTAFSLRGNAITIAPFCVDVADGSLCGEATREGTTGRATWQANDVTLTPFRAMLPDDVPLPDGRLRGAGTLAFDEAGLSRVDGNLESESLLLQLVGVEEVELGLRKLKLQGEWTRAGGDVTLESDLSPTGHVLARARIGADRTIDGQVSGHIERLDWVEAYTSQLANARGRVDIDLAVAGTLDAPRYTGNAKLTDFTAELPELGITLTQGTLALSSAGGRDLSVQGTVYSGGGKLDITGKFDPAEDDPLDVRVQGTNVLVADSPALQLRASPDLTASYDTDGKLLVLGGTLTLPSARIDASRVETSARRSPDVIVVDDPVVDGRRATPWRARVKIVLGNDVRIKGFGFDGRARGAIDVRQTASSDATASGELTVSGTYAAYGQKLKIQRGRVLYAGGPLDDPTLALRAQRELRDITAGVDVGGTAQNPVVTLYSSPSRTDAEVLSLLMTGRDPRGVSDSDKQSLGDAAVALGTVGGDALAQTLGGKLGFDEFAVGASDSLDGTAFTIGKYLTPRLYIGYGVGLITNGELFTVRFRINRRLELEANSGAENRAGVNYTIER
jgi:translocation and assembly module TamB